MIETIVTESMLLELLPFMEVTGTAVTYNREATMPAATFYDVGDTWTEATPTFTQVTATLKILGGDADVDNFLQATYADPNDIEAEVIASRAKSVAYMFNDTFFNGDSAVDAKSFDGLTKAVPAAQTGRRGGERRGADARPDGPGDRPGEAGRPDALLMSKRSRRKLSALRRASGNLLEVDRTDFGRRALFYDGIPIVVDDNQPDNEVQGTQRRGLLQHLPDQVRPGRRGDGAGARRHRHRGDRRAGDEGRDAPADQVVRRRWPSSASWGWRGCAA